MRAVLDEVDESEIQIVRVRNRVDKPNARGRRILNGDELVRLACAQDRRGKAEGRELENASHWFEILRVGLRRDLGSDECRAGGTSAAAVSFRT
jgi:hypothetical protein